MIDLAAQAQTPPFRFSQALLDTLGDDAERALLYARLRASQQVLVFQSQADARENPLSGDLPVWRGPMTFYP